MEQNRPFQPLYTSNVKGIIKSFPCHIFVESELIKYARSGKIVVKLRESLVAVTDDHTTFLVTRNHEGDPVPISITGLHVRRDDVEEYDERACAKGGLNRIRGMNLMPILMNLLDKTKKFGA